MARNLLIYIVGYGRSGSTVLDLALSAVCREAVSCGEVGTLPKVFTKPRLGCSCGKQYDSCGVWSGILQEALPDTDPYLLIKLYREDGLAGWVSNPSKKYLSFWEALFTRRHQVASATNTSSWVMIDSSKTVFPNSSRPLNLARLDNTDVVLIHLKRSLRGVLESRGRGKNITLAGLEAKITVGRWLLDRFWRLIVPVNWWLANLFANIAKRSNRIFLAVNVHFDDLKDNPERIAIELWAAICDARGIQLEIAETKSGVVFPEHIVEGNRLAKSKCGVQIDGG